MDRRFFVFLSLLLADPGYPAIIINEINANVPLHRSEREKFLELIFSGDFVYPGKAIPNIVLKQCETLSKKLTNDLYFVLKFC
jgi:hypothetical protein